MATDYAAQAQSLYESNLGRQGDAEGVAFWTNELASGKSAADVGSAFKESARQTYDNYLTNPNDPNKSNATISGLLSGDVQSSQQNAVGTFSGERQDNARTALDNGIYNNLYSDQKKTLAAPAYQSPAYAPQTNRTVDAANETIEGRITGLLSANNPVIQQAGNRAMQQFQQRGLLNSSMAIQAANEAMTAKAIEIAGPDAATYTKTGMLNQTEGNDFAQAEQQFGYDMQKQAADNAARGSLQTQQDAAALIRQNAGNADTIAANAAKAAENSSRLYADGVNTIEREYLAAVDSINNQDITPEVKTQRIAERRALTDMTINAWNAASRSLPGWSEQWAVLPVVGS